MREDYFPPPPPPPEPPRLFVPHDDSSEIANQWVINAFILLYDGVLFPPLIFLILCALGSSLLNALLNYHSLAPSDKQQFWVTKKNEDTVVLRSATEAHVVRQPLTKSMSSFAFPSVSVDAYRQQQGAATAGECGEGTHLLSLSPHNTLSPNEYAAAATATAVSRHPFQEERHFGYGSVNSRTPSTSMKAASSPFYKVCQNDLPAMLPREKTTFRENAGTLTDANSYPLHSARPLPPPLPQRQKASSGEESGNDGGSSQLNFFDLGRETLPPPSSSSASAASVSSSNNTSIMAEKEEHDEVLDEKFAHHMHRHHQKAQKSSSKVTATLRATTRGAVVDNEESEAGSGHAELSTSHLEDPTSRPSPSIAAIIQHNRYYSGGGCDFTTPASNSVNELVLDEGENEGEERGGMSGGGEPGVVGDDKDGDHGSGYRMEKTHVEPTTASVASTYSSQLSAVEEKRRRTDEYSSAPSPAPTYLSSNRSTADTSFFENAGKQPSDMSAPPPEGEFSSPRKQITKASRKYLGPVEINDTLEDHEQYHHQQHHHLSNSSQRPSPRPNTSPPRRTASASPPASIAYPHTIKKMSVTSQRSPTNEIGDNSSLPTTRITFQMTSPGRHHNRSAVENYLTPLDEADVEGMKSMQEISVPPTFIGNANEMEAVNARAKQHAIHQSRTRDRKELIQWVIMTTNDYFFTASLCKALILIVYFGYHFDHRGGIERLVVLGAAYYAAGAISPAVLVALRFFLPLRHIEGSLMPLGGRIGGTIHQAIHNPPSPSPTPSPTPYSSPSHSPGRHSYLEAPEFAVDFAEDTQKLLGGHDFERNEGATCRAGRPQRESNFGGNVELEESHYRGPTWSRDTPVSPNAARKPASGRKIRLFFQKCSQQIKNIVSNMKRDQRKEPDTASSGRERHFKGDRRDQKRGQGAAAGTSGGVGGAKYFAIDHAPNEWFTLDLLFTRNFDVEGLWNCFAQGATFVTVGCVVVPSFIAFVMPAWIRYLWLFIIPTALLLASRRVYYYSIVLRSPAVDLVFFLLYRAIIIATFTWMLQTGFIYGSIHALDADIVTIDKDHHVRGQHGRVRSNTTVSPCLYYFGSHQRDRENEIEIHQKTLPINLLITGHEKSLCAMSPRKKNHPPDGQQNVRGHAKIAVHFSGETQAPHIVWDYMSSPYFGTVATEARYRTTTSLRTYVEILSSSKFGLVSLLSQIVF